MVAGVGYLRMVRSHWDTPGSPSSISRPVTSRSSTRTNRSGSSPTESFTFEDIRTDLESRGHRFSTRSDSEIALHLYEDLGPECLHRLRGEFAFAIWDGRNQRLFAARDRFGVKPLFYA